MAILWCGGEDTDWAATGNSQASIGGLSGSNYRSGYARAANILSGAGSIRFRPFTASPITTGWLSGRILHNGTTDCLCLGFSTTDNPGRGLFVGTGDSTVAKLTLWKYDGTTKTALAAEAGTSFSAAIHKIDMWVQDYGASSTVKVYLNGTELISFSGDCTATGVTDLDMVAMGPGSGIGANYTYVSEIIVAEDDTRNMSVVTLAPSAAGDTNDWTGAYTDIDEVTINDADLIYDNTDGHQAMFNLANLPAGSFSVLAVRESVRACKSSDSTPQSLDIGIKSGSVDVADNHALSTTWDTYSRLMTVNPVTSLPFTPAEIDALQIVMESEA